MNDVTAVVLTIGEEHTARALASVRDQTWPVAETILVEGVSPFYRAINAGVARVRTEFFIQVDADMILDPTCVADLRGLMAPEVGIAVGQVRDPLRGRIPSIKLYRTRCFERVRFRDSICQDTDFAADVERAGWRRVYALLTRRAHRAEWHTFAAHEPEYTPLYTFCKFVTEGARSRYRPNERRFLNLFRQLRGSPHPAAPIATIGIAQGLFLQDERDRLRPCARTPEFHLLERFLGAAGADVHLPAPHRGLVTSSLSETFIRSHELAVRLRERHAAATFLATLRCLLRDEDLAASVALIGLCRGLFRERHYEADAVRDVAALHELLPPEVAAVSAGRASTRAAHSDRRT